MIFQEKMIVEQVEYNCGTGSWPEVNETSDVLYENCQKNRKKLKLKLLDFW